MAKRIKVFTTKLALTDGIFEKFVDPDFMDQTPVRVYDNLDTYSTFSYIPKLHVHANVDDAVEYAEVMRAKKLLHHRQAIRRLENMRLQLHSLNHPSRDIPQ